MRVDNACYPLGDTSNNAHEAIDGGLRSHRIASHAVQRVTPPSSWEESSSSSLPDDAGLGSGHDRFPYFSCPNRLFGGSMFYTFVHIDASSLSSMREQVRKRHDTRETRFAAASAG